MATEHYEMVNAVHARILGLPLTTDGSTALPVTQRLLRKLMVDRLKDQPLPAVFVSLPDQGAEEIDEGSKEHDDIGYPVQVTMVFASNQALTLNERPLQWRKLIRRAFHEKTLGPQNGVEAWHCEVTPQLIISGAIFREHNLDVGALLIRCWVNEDRYQRGQDE